MSGEQTVPELKRLAHHLVNHLRDCSHSVPIDGSPAERRYAQAFELLAPVILDFTDEIVESLPDDDGIGTHLHLERLIVVLSDVHTAGAFAGSYWSFGYKLISRDYDLKGALVSCLEHVRQLERRRELLLRLREVDEVFQLTVFRRWPYYSRLLGFDSVGVVYRSRFDVPDVEEPRLRALPSLAVASPGFMAQVMVDIAVGASSGVLVELGKSWFARLFRLRRARLATEYKADEVVEHARTALAVKLNLKSSNLKLRELSISSSEPTAKLSFVHVPEKKRYTTTIEMVKGVAIIRELTIVEPEGGSEGSGKVVF